MPIHNSVSGLHCFQWQESVNLTEILSTVQSFFFCCSLRFFLCLYNIFLFYYDVPGCGLLYVHATWSSLCFLNVEIVFSSNLGSFQQDFFSYFFLFLSLLSRNLYYMHFLELHGVPHFLRFCSFSSLFSIIRTT